jgi:hypothetical protein
MKRLILFTWLLVVLFNCDLFSQSKLANRKNFLDAESLILYEDYQEALPIYQQLLKNNPGNSNLKFRIGQCYLNIPGEKAKAIGYLEDAVKNINPNYRKEDLKETGSPYDALYLLGNAYRINNQIDKALQTFELFKKNLNSEIYDSNIVELQIHSCLNAKELMKAPVYIREHNLGNTINRISSEFNPVISDNEDMLVFSRSGAFYDAILYSTKVNGQWTEPLNMNQILRVDRDLYPNSLSKDGKTLYLYSSDNYDGNIYTSQFINGDWSPIVKLNENINTKYWESHATISHDNKKLYFTSNRKGTFGGLDIYVSKRDSSGNWGPAVNLGPVINTPYNEESPFLSRDDKTIFFSSRGHFNMGGYDVFYSSLLNNGEWSVPRNIGYPVNSTDDDLFYDALNNGFEGYYAKESPNGYGKQDIYRIEIFSKDNPRKFTVRGNVKVYDATGNLNESVKISAINISDPGQTFTAYSDPKTGEYELRPSQGNYKVSFESAKSEKLVQNLDLPLTYPSDNILLPGVTLPGKAYAESMNAVNNKAAAAVKGDSILIPVQAEAGAIQPVEPRITDSLAGANKGLIVTDEQIAAFTRMLMNRADDELRKVIENADIIHQKFRNLDDLISYLKKEASAKNISPEEVDQLALKVAVMDNVLTQAAVNQLAKYSEGFLKEILSDLNIYELNLKTWTDLLEFIQSKSGGKITGREINRIADGIIAGIDRSVARLKEKIVAYSAKSGFGNTLLQSVATADQMNSKLIEEWLQSFYRESIRRGLTDGQMTAMLTAISSMPGTKVEQFLSDLSGQSEDPLISSLKSLDPIKDKITSPKDLLFYLITSSDKVRYPENAVYKAIAKLIIAKDIPPSIIALQLKSGLKSLKWILWLITGTGFCIVLYFLLKRKKNGKK